MNRAYRLVWNHRLATWVAASEISRGRGKLSGTAGAALLAVGSLLAPCAMAVDAGALPSGGQITAGRASLQTSGTNLTVEQASTRAVIEWQRFDIGSGASVTFRQPGAGSIALNRVVGQDASQIMGRLGANGQVFLLNPNGVLFGSTAQVSVGGLVASTLGLADDDFMLGSSRLAGRSSASVVNRGSLAAADGGYVALLGAEVRNEGVVSARLGMVALAAGNDMTLNLDNGSLFGLTVDRGAVVALADNSQLIQAEGGRVLLTAKAADRLISAVVNNSGVIEARGVQAADGSIRLLGDGGAGMVVNNGRLDAGRVDASARSMLHAGRIEAGSVDLSAAHALVMTQDARIRAEGGDIRLDGGAQAYLSGTVDAAGGAGNAAGGRITVAGRSVTLAAATLDASGATPADRAGSIRVGGGAHGRDTDLANATTTTVSGASMLKADGHAGSIVVWSDDTTRYAGRAEAGTAGFIEVSSKGTLELGGSTRVGAEGHILYDPTHIVIDAAQPSVYHVELADPTPTAGDYHGNGGITALAGGNLVVSSPNDSFGGAQAGATYLYNGASGALISALYGSSANDRVGNNGVTKLANGNYVVRSGNWANGSATNAGAVTWGSGTAGVSGTVSAANSLVGSSTNDTVGGSGQYDGLGPYGMFYGFGGDTVTVLSNGNYVVSSSNWSNGNAASAGAVTWGSGATGVSGAVSAANSLVGSRAYDRVGGGMGGMGGGGVTVLTNGNYVVVSSDWANGSAASAGAVTWGSGTAGINGAVSVDNSLVGERAYDRVGRNGVTALTNGNYVVASSLWTNGSITGAGAATWGSGTTGVSGIVSAANSLVGSNAHDSVGSDYVTALNNGNYVVASSNWSNGSATYAGAVTWSSGTAGITGTISIDNSLVGSTAYDHVGNRGITALTNGNYVVSSSNWANGSAAAAGAVTWGSGTIGINGTVSAANSLVGSSTNDAVGNGPVRKLTNGNYVVGSSNWANGSATNAGAVTWGSGTAGVTGAVSAANSLVGSSTDDQVGSNGLDALTNGNYLVRSDSWANGSATKAGAVTWGSGTTGVNGAVSAANSLVGSSKGDQVGFFGLKELANGNYVVSSGLWANGTAASAGAVTWGSGTTGVSGTVSAANSLIGSSANDSVGNYGITALTNGNYVVSSGSWANGSATNAGAVTWGSGTAGISGAVSAINSLVGSSTNDYVGNNGITALSNGSYVVGSSSWTNGNAARAGAVTWGSGTTGVSGAVSAINSLVGSSANDYVGNNGITALTNGNYVVRSGNWANGSATAAGAVTWGSGTAGVSGAVSAANSIIGSSAGESLGNRGLTTLPNGGYVISTVNYTTGIGNVRLVSEPSSSVSALMQSSGAVAINPALLAQAAGAGSTVTLQASEDITVNSPVAIAGGLELLAGNALTLNVGGTITSTASGDAIVLSGRSFVNHAGSGALSADNGRWLVYSDAPAGNGFGGLASGNAAVWNATRETRAPATIADGNRYVFAQQPRVDVIAAAQSKSYDGSAFAAPGYTSSGLVDAASHGNVFTQDVLTGSLDAGGANAGRYAIGRGTLAAPAGYLMGYTGAEAVIDPRSVTIAGLSALSRDYDGSDEAALAGGTVTGTVAGETLGFAGHSGRFDDRHAGVGKRVTVSGLALVDGSGLASNYRVEQPAGLSADIGPRPLTAHYVASGKTYDGTDAAVVSASSADILPGDGVSLSHSGAAFASPEAGPARTVRISGISLGGPDAGNYALQATTATATADIAALPAVEPPPVVAVTTPPPVVVVTELPPVVVTAPPPPPVVVVTEPAPVVVTTPPPVVVVTAPPPAAPAAEAVDTAGAARAAALADVSGPTANPEWSGSADASPVKANHAGRRRLAAAVVEPAAAGRGTARNAALFEVEGPGMRLTTVRQAAE